MVVDGVASEAYDAVDIAGPVFHHDGTVVSLVKKERVLYRLLSPESR